MLSSQMKLPMDILMSLCLLFSFKGGSSSISRIANRSDIRRIRLHKGFEFVIADLSNGQSGEDHGKSEENQRFTHGSEYISAFGP